MLNVVALNGRLTADPELRHTNNDIAVASFTLAVDRSYQRQEEDRQTDFISIVTWRRTAEFASKYFRKGQLVAVEGSIQTRKYTDRDGNKRTEFEVVANNVHFAEPKAKNESGSPQFKSDNQPDNSDFEEISSDDDLPF